MSNLNSVSPDLEVMVLEDLDFEITCEVTIYKRRFSYETPPCGKTAAYSAMVHNIVACAWVHKFICAECVNANWCTVCDTCGAAPRLKDLKPINKAS